ncbi:NFACT protein RNA-binding domain-containing protein [Elsinoe fawcettii]|nr:NFACT protein RNA-binding domain-containing protein [Elsinoe fawcettii]
MVLYFTSTTVDPSAYIYMGRDKFENEDLIKFGWEEDVCLKFHVDNLSSAHVYVRLPEGQTWDKIEEPLLVDCAQLTKANSIEGNKKDNITVIYTPWSNLRKDGSMATGQVSFHDQKKVKRIHVEKRENVIVNRLNKTKVERQPDLRQEKEDRQRELRKRDQKSRQERAKEEARIAKERKEAKYHKDHAYDEWNDEDALQASSNQDRDADFLDDFM